METVEVMWIGGPASVSLADMLEAEDRARQEFHAGTMVNYFVVSNRTEGDDLPGKVARAVHLCIVLMKDHEVLGEILVDGIHLAAYLAGLRYTARECASAVEKAIQNIKDSRSIVRNKVFKDIRIGLEQAVKKLRDWI